MKRAVVLGGGGHFGAAICAALRAEGWQVCASTLGPGPRGILDDLEVERRVGNDMVPGAMATLVAGADLVIDAAAPYALNLHDAGHSHRDRLDAAQQRMASLLSVCRAQGAPLIYVGSYLTRPNPQAGRLAALFEKAHPYFTMKRQLERQALTAAGQGQHVYIVNPTSFLGPGNLRPIEQCFVAAIMHGKMPASFPDIINVMDVRDAAAALIRLPESGLIGLPVTLSGHDISVHALTDMICDLAQVARPPRWRGLAAGAMVLYSAETLLALVGRDSAYPSLPVLLTLASHACAISPEQRALGLEPRPLSETVADEINWYRQREAARGS